MNVGGCNGLKNSHIKKYQHIKYCRTGIFLRREIFTNMPKIEFDDD